MPSPVKISVEKTRPADTDNYSANDVISESATNGAGTKWTFSNVGRSGWVTQARVEKNAGSDTPSLVLFLFSDDPTGELDDNAANTNPVYANISNYIGHIDFDAMESLGASTSWTLATPGTGGNLPLRYITTEDALYGVLATRDAWTPGSGEKITVTLFLDRD